VDAALSTRPYTALPRASAHAYEELKASILLGRVPMGVRLREERLARRFGVSRTPAREALLRLHAERFLDRHPEGGYRVATPSVRTMSELYEVRRALELFAVRRGCAGGHDAATLDGLRVEWSSLASDVEAEAAGAGFVLVDEAFHGTLADAAGNRRLTDELRRVNELIRPVRSHDFVTPGRVATTIRQHLEILDAVFAGDGDGAAERLDSHIRESQAVVELAVGRALERMLRDEEGELPW
jgi:DNA-binding GntR family transcriptional regulator